MTAYVGFNWFCTLATGAILLAAVLRDRFLILKPSVVVLLFFHVRVQWSATVEAAFIEQYLRSPFAFAALAQGFPLVGSIGAVLFGHRHARVVWRRLRDTPRGSALARRRAMVSLAACTGLAVVLFLGTTALRDSGLYAILFNAGASAAARTRFAGEAFGGSAWRYSFHFMVNVFAPLLAALIALRADDDVRSRNWAGALVGAALILVLTAIVSLSGARSYSASLLLVVIWVFLLRRRFPLNPVVIAFGVVVVLALPTAMSLMREGRVLDTSLLWQYLTRNIASRVTIDTMEPGLWHVHYAQYHGFVGVAGVPRLADLAGVRSLNMPNLIGNLYAPGGHGETGGANASYVFSYYSYFGLWTLFPSLLGVWALDLALLVYARLRDHLLLAVIAVTSVAATNFVSAEYTTVLLTNGFAVTLAVGWVFSHRGWRKRLVFRPVDATAARAARGPA